MALDEISQNVAVSSGNVSDNDSSGNTCCMLPQAEFLSPKFWKKTEGQYSSSRVSFSGRKQLAYVVSDLPNKDAHSEKVKPDDPKSQQQNGNNYLRHRRMPKNILVSGCSGLDEGSVENLARFLQRATQVLAQLNSSNSNGMFINACASHCQTQKQETWFGKGTISKLRDSNCSQTKLFCITIWIFARNWRGSRRMVY